MKTKSIISKYNVPERTLQLKPIKKKIRLEQRIIDYLKEKGETRKEEIYIDIYRGSYILNHLKIMERKGIIIERSCECKRTKYISLRK